MPRGSKPQTWKKTTAAIKIQRKWRGAMKKTTKKGAYGKHKKQVMVNRRNPMVETKRRVNSIIMALNASQAGVPSTVEGYKDYINGATIPNNDAYTLITLPSYYRNSHGFLEHNCLGDSIFSKYLKLKVQLRFPEGVKMIVNPVKLYLITGWVTAPPAFTTNTTPTEGDATQQHLRDHLTAQLKEYFDQREDFLRFREKTTSNVRILKWQSLKPNLNGAIAAVPAQADTEVSGAIKIRTMGAVPAVNRSFTWKTMRKVHLSQGTALATGTDALDPDTQNLYPNNQWLPFALIYNPDFARMRDALDVDTTCTLAWNDIHYYTDS